MDLELSGRRVAISGTGRLAERCAAMLRAEDAEIVADDGELDGCDAMIVIAPDFPPGSIDEVGDAEATAAFAHVEALAALFRAPLEGMKRRGGGRLIWVGPIAAKQLPADDRDAVARLVGLGALGLCKAVAGELGPHGITCNSVLWDACDVDSAAAAVSFLASGPASYVSGVAIGVDGGRGARPRRDGGGRHDRTGRHRRGDRGGARRVRRDRHRRHQRRRARDRARRQRPRPGLLHDHCRARISDRARTARPVGLAPVPRRAAGDGRARLGAGREHRMVVARETIWELPHILPNAARPAAAGLHRMLSARYAGTGVTVNSLLTGSIATERNVGYFTWLAAERGLTLEQVVAENSQRTPLRRPGRPEEMASVAAFLCSDAAGGISGQAIAMSGGNSRHVF